MATEGQQHPLSIYFWIWGLLFVFSAFSYASDFLPHGYFRWGLILALMFAKAGFIIAIFMHMKWER
ncbi:MAG TPA: cytochrome C oxidase subunit IV family protein, partial [Gammaproteobacteria bacterium]|nr:cytochrome C oxidase subunit IV family protein [Gammaproteobacteria bacterium]